jgi:AI-2 transport protein TqsA
MGIDLTRRIAGVVSSAQSFVVSLLLIIAYVGFLFVESAYMRQKIAAMFPDEIRAREVNSVLAAVSESVRRYIWIKTVVSTLTAVASYGVLWALGVDFAATWALLIFLLNYIPNIGSIIAVSFPALVSLVQFDTLGSFFVLVLSLTAIQLVIGSVLEPMLMGHTLNMSPFRHHPVARFLGSNLGHCRNVLESAHHGADDDRVRPHPELEMGGNSAVEGWPRRCVVRRQPS